MKACAEYELLLHGLVDEELDAANASACEQHLAGCESCSTVFNDARQLRQRLRASTLRFSASDRLRSNIEGELQRQSHLSRQNSSSASRSGKFQRVLWPAITFAMAACFALIVLLRPAPDRHGILVNDIVAAHLRSLQADHLLDVATSDRHTVKPWFAGKIDFSPPVPDLADRDFALAGGRIDYFQNHPAAALAYRRRAHVINLFVWPETGADLASSALTVDGYNLIHWRKDAMAYWGISDLNAEELGSFHDEYVARGGR